MSFLGHLSLRQIATTTSFRAHISHFRPQIRRFSVSSRRTAEESPKSDIWPALNEFKETKLFTEIQSNTELREALLDAMKVMQEEGFDPNKPSMMMLVTNSRIREVMTRVAAQVQAAGIDPAAAKEAFDLMKSKMNPK